MAAMKKPSTVTFFFPAPGFYKGQASLYAWTHGYGHLMHLKTGQTFARPKNHERWRTRQEQYRIRMLEITTFR